MDSISILRAAQRKRGARSVLNFAVVAYSLHAAGSLMIFSLQCPYRALWPAASRNWAIAVFLDQVSIIIFKKIATTQWKQKKPTRTLVVCLARIHIFQIFLRFFLKYVCSRVVSLCVTIPWFFSEDQGSAFACNKSKSCMLVMAS